MSRLIIVPVENGFVLVVEEQRSLVGAEQRSFAFPFDQKTDLLHQVEIEMTRIAQQGRASRSATG